MALSRVRNLELISEKDAAVSSIDPLIIKEGEDPFVFVFKPHTDLSVNREYLEMLVDMEQLLPQSDGDNKEKIAKLSPKEQIDLMIKSKEIQLNIIDLLLIGYRQKIDGELIEKTPELLEIIKENDVIVEFFNKINRSKTDINNKKKS